MAYDMTFAVLADPTRRAVLERLRRGPLAVGEIARHLPVSRPAVSQHLKKLKAAGLVHERHEGTRRVYAVRRDGLAGIKRYIESYWDEALASFRAHVEETRRGRGD